MSTTHNSNRATRSGRTALVVVGMHRSGTSALAGCLHALGVPFGEPLLPANFANERGYFEHAEVVATHDRLLEDLGTSALHVVPLPNGWLDQPASQRAREVLRDILVRNLERGPVWCVKDPRICLVLPLWKSLFAELGIEARYLLVFRSPWEVFGSLRKRDSLSAAEALELWHRYTTNAEFETRGTARVLLTFDRLLSEPLARLEAISEAFGLPWPTPLPEASPAVLGFLEPSLRHFAEAQGTADLAPALTRSFDALWAGFVALSRSDDVEGRARVDGLASTCTSAAAGLDAIRLARSASADEYGVRWLDLQCPETLVRGEPTLARAAFQVIGSQALSRRALSVSYHWADAEDPSRPGIWEGARTPVLADIAPGTTWSGPFVVQAPPAPGRYLLKADLVRERVAWFSGRGVPPIEREVTVT